MKFLFSPCLYCKNSDTFDLYPLNSVLDFICKYLDGNLDNFTNCFYSDERLQCPPVMDYNQYNLYSSVIKALYKLKIGGNDISVDENTVNYSVTTPNYCNINPVEFQYLVDYLNQCPLQEYILFLGERNWNITNEYLNIDIKSRLFQLPIIKNPLYEKSENYNPYLKNNSKNPIFVNSEVCSFLDKEMKSIAKGNTDNTALYKKYGEIIALRNRFHKYDITDKYMNTDYYESYDGKYIIATDLLHGHFELFQGSGKQLWINQYNFSGVELPINGKFISKNEVDSKTLNEMRNTHRVHKR